MAKHKVHVEIETPRVPSYLMMADGQKVPVSAVTEDALRQIGAAWTEELIARAREQATPLGRVRLQAAEEPRDG